MFISDIQHDGTIHYATEAVGASNTKMNNHQPRDKKQHKNKYQVPEALPRQHHTSHDSTNPVDQQLQNATMTTSVAPPTPTLPPKSTREGYVPAWFTDDVSRLAVLTRNFIEGMQREQLPVERRRSLDRLDLKPASALEVQRMRRNLGLE